MLTYYKKYIKRQLYAAKNISNRKNVHFSLKKYAAIFCVIFFVFKALCFQPVFWELFGVCSPFWTF